jgi:tRNA ligase
MAMQDPHGVRLLVQSLEAASKKHGKQDGKKSFSCKKTTFVVSKDVSVDSWRFMDWDYKRPDLPTYARGLFTTKLQNGRDEICTRGYDKFFNVDEVNDTQWRNVEGNTRGPYELSVKENGCIIFISGLEDGTLLVCSKHSTGSRSDVLLSHAQAGEQWVEKHLSKVGKTVKELALELRKLNATAVGELCDDRFEEHVLAYDEAAAGIYLHGINFNVPEFATLPSSEVHKFADDWGFRKAEFVVIDDIRSVKEFLDKCAETGSWNNRDTEGFVIRCQLGDAASGIYRDWFFKYKFEEPYLMYRQWREVTKAVIAGKLPNIRKHKKITEEYLLYARQQLAKDPKIGKLYNQNHGIISMREGFLNERGLKGSEIIAMENEGELGSEETAAKNFVLIPIASIGCGKTTVALALSRLFDWGHVQNDNLGQQKNKPKKFALQVTNSLALKPAVIADRNNHQKRERSQIMDDVAAIIPDAKFIALQYVHEPKGLLLDHIRSVTRERVLSRGDNHQTIRAGSKDTGEVISIMEGFLKRFEAVDTDRQPDMYFHEVIDLDIGDSSRVNLEKIVRKLHSAFPNLVKRVPDSAELDAAIASALNDYQVDSDLSWTYDKRNEKKKNKEKTPMADDNNNTKPKSQDPTVLVKNIEYVGITVAPSEIHQLLTSIFASNTAGSSERNKLFNHLTNSRRIQPSFHVTLIHRAHSKEQPGIWNQYADLYIERMNERLSGGSPITTTPPKLADARVRVERLIWNNDIMAFVVRILSANSPDGGDNSSSSSWACVNSVPHITVGTASPDVKPKQSNDLLQKWLEVGSGGDTGIWEAEIPGVKVLDGAILPVMMRGK